MSLKDNKNKEPEVDMRERFYKPLFLAKLFFIASVVLFIMILGLFLNDYFSEWRDYQSRYKKEQVKKLREMKEEAEKVLGQNQEYQNLLREVDAQKESLGTSQEEWRLLEEELTVQEEEYLFALRDYQETQAQYDALVYQFDKKHQPARQVPKVMALKEDVDKKREVSDGLYFSISELKKHIATLKLQSKEKENELKKLSASLIKVENKLKEIDPEMMNKGQKIAEHVRNLPVMEIFIPSQKIEQKVYPHLKENLNFTAVPTAERCLSCHQGIMEAGNEDLEQPFKTHPRLDLFVGDTSPHPIDKISCVSCHQGRARGTSFVSAAHTPQSEEQKKEWEEKYGWKELPHWNKKMLPLPVTQASCLKCHQSETELEGAEKLMLGRALIDVNHCAQCHTMGMMFDSEEKTGPSLRHLHSKVHNKDWIYRWLAYPEKQRPGSGMPQFWDWENMNERETLRAEQEILAITAYLQNQSQPLDDQKIDDIEGDAEVGEELVDSLGCLACHRIDTEWENENDLMTEDIYRRYGPNLVGLADKVDPKWLYQWLKDPHAYYEDTRMPDMRLSTQEAKDIAAYLLSDDLQLELDKDEIPGLIMPTIEEVAVDFMMSRMTRSQAMETLEKMPEDERVVFLGEKLVKHYMCMNCHDMNADAVDIEKVSLEKIGDQDIHKFDFGVVHDIPHTKYAWLDQKIKDPRRFDREMTKQPLEYFKMPHFAFTDEEREAVVTVLLGLVDTRFGVLRPDHGDHASFIRKGRRLIRDKNCQACHVIEGRVDKKSPILNDTSFWLEYYRDKDEYDAEDLAQHYSPPSLVGVGKKLRIQWMKDYLENPTVTRDWLQVRMPSFQWRDDEVNTLVTYLAVKDKAPFPFSPTYNYKLDPIHMRAAETLVGSEYFSCARCHFVDGTPPTGEEDSWAPDFKLAKDRLRPEWIIEWIKDPAKITPGTTMPAFYPKDKFDSSGPEEILGGDEEAQLEALRHYVYSVGE